MEPTGMAVAVTHVCEGSEGKLKQSSCGLWSAYHHRTVGI